MGFVMGLGMGVMCKIQMSRIQFCSGTIAVIHAILLWFEFFLYYIYLWTAPGVILLYII